jgi:hypothetical protein
MSGSASFQGREEVHLRLLPVCRQTIQTSHPRRWLNGDSVLLHVRTSSYCPVAFQEAEGMPT